MRIGLLGMGTIGSGVYEIVASARTWRLPACWICAPSPGWAAN